MCGAIGLAGLGHNLVTRWVEGSETFKPKLAGARNGGGQRDYEWHMIRGETK